MYRFRLYVVGEQPRSVNAAKKLKHLFGNRLESNYELEVIDLLKRPELGSDDRILATPTLAKLSPPPIRRVVGDFRNTENLLALLGVAGQTEDNSTSSPRPSL